MILKHDHVFLAGELQIKTMMKSPIFKLQKQTKKVSLALYFLGETVGKVRRSAILSVGMQKVKTPVEWNLATFSQITNAFLIDPAIFTFRNTS